MIFNNQFEEYLGKQKGSKIKQLLQHVSAINQTYRDYNRKVCITEAEYKNIYSSTDIHELIIKKIKSEEFYEVSMYRDEGFINKIFIRREGESKTEEELNLEKTQIEYSKHLEEEQKELEEYEKELEERNKKEEKNKKIAIIVISILALIGLILIIKGFIILKKGDESKKHKVLIAFIITESIITGGLLLILLGIITGEIYYMF